MQQYIWETPSEINRNLAKRLKAIRKRKGYTQEQLAVRCNVSYGALKHFEQTGRISLIGLTKIAMELDLAEELRSLFTEVPYKSLEEVLRDQ
ncbi:MAG: helix-turn-helix transcriptional regulator [Lachnospiraceae bacterium]|nr:helix-turn-helix transcriptional regulator [Lachnospiraceae bacterium]